MMRLATLLIGLLVLSLLFAGCAKTTPVDDTTDDTSDTAADEDALSELDNTVLEDEDLDVGDPI